MQAITSIPGKSPFLRDDFLLESKLAEDLYLDAAAPQPIIDYHNHLSPQDVAANRRFGNMTEIWLLGDHYKWRAMRANGVGEEFITGAAPDKEKFIHWAKTVPHTLRNPLFHWTHMELLNPFGVNTLLDGSNAEKIYDHCNERLQELPVHALLDHFNVSWICTTDHPLDDLSAHEAANRDRPGRMVPGFRPDALLDFSSAEKFRINKERLEQATGISILNMDDYTEALKKRVEYFHERGCRISDHGFSSMPRSSGRKSAAEAFAALLQGKKADEKDADRLRGAILLDLCRLYHRLGWVQQFHVGALRNNNTRLGHLLGADAGTDSIHDLPQAERMAAFLDKLDATGELARTILYNLNPADNAVFATMAGNFQDGIIPGKIQWGAAWWFLDQKNGMEEHMKVLSDMGLLSRFIGMLTDSRSFLSFSRHEYFRRILCNTLANDMQKGIIPSDKELIADLVRRICYGNARDYFSRP